ncbi:MAG: YceI family protein [Bacteroidales bacterium]
MKIFTIHILLLLLGNSFLFAQNGESPEDKLLYVLESVNIKGRTNVNSFEFIYDSTIAKKVDIDKDANYLESANDEVTFELPVRAFDSKNPIMNRDFYEMLEAGAHPKIFVSIKKSALKDIAEGNPSDSIDMKLTIVGVTREIKGGFSSQENSDKAVLLKGLTKINLKKYPIEMPGKMLGILSVDETISINFDVVVKQ